MAFEFSNVEAFLNEYGIWLIIIGGMAFGIVFLISKFKGVKKIPDYVKIFNEQSIKDESLNKRNKLDPKWIVYGDEKIGKIMTIDTNRYSYTPTKEEFATKAGISQWEDNITTVTFRDRNAIINLWLGEKKIMRFKDTEGKRWGDKLIFSSDLGFTALGNQYTTKTGFKETSGVIEADYSKRLFEGNVTIMASKMAGISGETPEFAQERELRRLEIEKIRMEKQSKIGGLV